MLTRIHDYNVCFDENSAVHIFNKGSVQVVLTFMINSSYVIGINEIIRKARNKQTRDGMIKPERNHTLPEVSLL